MLHFEDSYFLIAAAMIFSLLLALFVYYKDNRFKEASTFSKVLLVCFRFLSLAVIFLLLFKPQWIHSVKKVEKPIIVFLQDASTSILNYEDSLYYKTEFIEALKQNNTILAEDFELYNYHFSDSIYEDLSSNYTGSSTAISHALNEIENKFYQRNLAAIILATDGNYTKGLQPNYSINKLNVPVFTLALGDSSVKNDIAIEQVRYNEIAYLDNQFPLEFELHSSLNSNEKHYLQLKNKGELVYEEWLYLAGNIPLTKSILIEAKKEGIQYYDLSISSFEGEQNIQNNRYRLAIEVLNNRQNVLLLSAAPHPDIAAVKSALELGKNYKVHSALFHEFKEEIEAYNLIVLHQIPEHSNRNTQLLTKIKESNTSVLFITGKNTNWTKFNNFQEVLSVNSKNSSQVVFPLLNENFSPFEFSDHTTNFIKSAPPLIAPFGDVERKNYSHSLFKQQIEGIKTTKELFTFYELEDKTIGVLLAEGLWKWKLYDYQQNKSHDHFNEIIQSVSQYLTLNKDKRKLRLHYPKLSIQGESFKLNAQLYNDNYKLIENAELNLTLLDEERNEYIYTLANRGTNYNTTIANLSEGNYEFTLQANYKNEELLQKGSFAILASTVEQQNLQADWDLLKKMSYLTGGSFITKPQFSEYSNIVKAKISSKPAIYFSKQLSDLIKQKRIFFVLLLSLFFEWALRKKLGTH